MASDRCSLNTVLALNRKDWGNIRAILGLYGDNGKEHGNYYSGLYSFLPGCEKLLLCFLGFRVQGISP